MTVSSTTSRWEYTGDGTTDDFTFSNKIFATSDVKVYLDGVLKTLSTHYTVALNGDQDNAPGGTVTFLTAPADDAEVAIVRQVANTQETDLPLAGPFPSDSVEDELDRRTIISQQQAEEFERSIHYPATEFSVPSGEVPAKAARIGKLFGWGDEGQPVGVAATDASSTAVTATGSTSARLLAERFADFLSVKDFGGIGDDLTDNSVAKAALHTAAGVNGAGWYLKPGYNANEFATPYHADVKDARAFRVQVGRASAPATSPEPVAWFSKTFATTRAVNPAEWDVGALYADADKQSGDAYGAALTAFARYTGGTGDLVAGHFRARGNVAGAQIFGGWSYAHWATGTVGQGRVIAHEFDINNAVGDPGWATEAAAGALSAIAIKMADGTLPGTHAIRIAYGGASDQKFWTGIQIGQNSIMPTDGSGNGEAIRIAGGSSPANDYIGIRMESGSFYAGLTTAGATIADNAALWLSEGHKLVFGTVKSAGLHLTAAAGVMSITGAVLDLVDATGELRVAGTKVVDARVTGWGQPTGTKTRTTFATTTVTLPELAERVYALLEDLGVGAVAGKHGLVAV